MCFICTPIPGQMIQFDEHIFQVGWFNHHLVTYLTLIPTEKNANPGKDFAKKAWKQALVTTRIFCWTSLR